MEEWEVLRQLPLPCLLKAVIGTSDEPCCSQHQGKFTPRRPKYHLQNLRRRLREGDVKLQKLTARRMSADDRAKPSRLTAENETLHKDIEQAEESRKQPKSKSGMPGHFAPWYDLKDWRQGGVAACIRHARARLMEKPWKSPGNYDASVQAGLVRALNVKVWMSCMWEMAEWQSPGEGPRRMTARPLAVAGTARGQPDGGAPPALPPLVAILRPNGDGPGHCWLTLTPAQTACLGLVYRAHGYELTDEMPYCYPKWHSRQVSTAQTKGLCPLWVRTPEGSFAWKQLYDVTTSQLHGALLDALHPAHQLSARWTMRRSPDLGSVAVKQLIYEHEAGPRWTGGKTLQELGPRDPTGREILKGATYLPQTPNNARAYRRGSIELYNGASGQFPIRHR